MAVDALKRGMFQNLVVKVVLASIWLPSESGYFFFLPNYLFKTAFLY